MTHKHLLKQLTTTVTHALQRQNSQRPARVLIALSGGPDSTLLLHLAVRAARSMPLQIFAAHLDHGWRAESTADARWCAALCQKVGVPFFCTTLQVIARQHKLKPNGSREALARTARRLWLQEVAQRVQAPIILLGHHAQDQQETFFIRLLRGSSLDGLGGMRIHEGIWMRPLLQTTKQDILQVLNTLQAPYLVDASNSWQTLLRNRVRHQLLPALRQCDNRFEVTLQHTMEMLQEEHAFLDKLTTETLEQLQSTSDAGISTLDRSGLLALDDVVLRRVLLKYLITQGVPFTPSTGFLQELVRYVRTAQPGSAHNVNAAWQLSISKQSVAIKKQDYQDITL